MIKKLIAFLLAITCLFSPALGQDATLLLDASAPANASVLNAEKNAQSFLAGEVDGKPAIEVKWDTASNRVLELVFANGPAIEGIAEGKTLLIEINRTNLQGFSGLGVRVKDVSGRIFHYPAKLEGAGGGWESFPVEIGSDLAPQQFGHGAANEKKSLPDEPAVLLSLVFRAPANFSDEASIAIGNITIEE